MSAQTIFLELSVATAVLAVVGVFYCLWKGYTGSKKIIFITLLVSLDLLLLFKFWLNDIPLEPKFYWLEALYWTGVVTWMIAFNRLLPDCKDNESRTNKTA